MTVGDEASDQVDQEVHRTAVAGVLDLASGRALFHLATSVSIALFEAELAAFARQAGARPKKKIVLVWDRAGWYTSLRLRVPDHVYLHFLPPYSPELQPDEHLWPFTNAPLTNRHFASIEDLEEAQALCRAPGAARPHPLHDAVPLVATALPQTTCAQA